MKIEQIDGGNGKIASKKITQEKNYFGMRHKTDGESGTQAKEAHDES